MTANQRKALRCAIYTRKSSEHGLEQDFAILPFMHQLRRRSPRHHEMNWLAMMAFTQAANHLPGYDPAITVTPDHHGTIEERQQLRHDLIGQFVDALRHRFGAAVLTPRRLHGEDVIFVWWIEQEVGEQ